ncbi:MAG: class I SAM-dependent methyltransferase [Clostridia bacterium]|nr:class I SAM-dependent methyltransferase [Clostridia bacterium]
MQVSGVDGGQQFDFGKTSESYSKYRDIYPDLLYDILKSLGTAKDGSSWLDLGTGTGILPRNLYNPKADITAVDIAENQIEHAKADAAENNMKIKYIVSAAESTGLPDNCYDVITAAQCFPYFDRQKIIPEIKRMLKPCGKFIIIYMDWDLNDKIFEKSAQIIKKYNPLWNPDNGGNKIMYADFLPRRETKVYECEIPFTRESWHGRMCACRGTAASMDENTFSLWESEHKKHLETVPEKFTVSHKLFISVFQI